MNVLQHVLQFLTGDAVRVLASLIFSFGWKANPKTVTRAIPFIVVVGNIALAIASLLTQIFSGQDPTTINAVFAAASDPNHLGLGAVFHDALVTFGLTILDGLKTALLPIGIHSGLKNFKQWRQEGGGFKVPVTQ